MASIYVAGPSVDLPRVRRVQSALREAGHIISHDWTADVELARSQGLVDADVPLDRQRGCARADLAAIGLAHIVVVLWPVGGQISVGTAVELGAALAGRWPIVSHVDIGPARVVIAGGDLRSAGIWLSLIDCWCTSDDEAVRWTLETAKTLPPHARDPRLLAAIEAAASDTSGHDLTVPRPGPGGEGGP